MTRLPWRDRFAAVLSIDNAVAHLEHEATLNEALVSMHDAAAMGGRLALSVRDYAPLLLERPPGTVPVRFERDGTPHVYVQSWTWDDDRPACISEVFLLSGPEWTVVHSRARFRAWTLDEITSAAAQAGWLDLSVLTPEESGFYQPIVTGLRAPAA